MTLAPSGVFINCFPFFWFEIALDRLLIKPKPAELEIKILDSSIPIATPYYPLGLRRYRLMVRTLVFETSNPGSIPGNAIGELGY